MSPSAGAYRKALNAKRVDECLKRIYHEPHDSKFSRDYRDRVRLVIGVAKTGAVIFFADESDETVWWIDGYSTGKMPSVRRMRYILFLCGFLGAKFVAINTERFPRFNKYWRRVGLQQLDEHTFSIRTEPKWT